MYGLLEWNENRPKRVMIEETAILRVPFLRVSVPRGGPEGLTRRRLAWALRRCRKLGVMRWVLPEGFPYGAVLEKQGLRPISTLPLRRALAADWAGAELAARGIGLSGAQVAVTGDTLTGEMVRTVTELSLRHRYVLLSVPRGGEELSRRLRREFGVSVQLNPSREELEKAAILVAFSPGEVSHPLVLRLYDESQRLPLLSLPPAQESQLPPRADRGQLFTVLREAGAVPSGAFLLEAAPPAALTF